MNLSRRRLLAAAAAAAGLAPAALASSTPGRPKRLIFIFADGGWDTSFLLEPKFSSKDVDGPWVDENPENPDDREYEAAYGDYSVVLNDWKRPSVSEFFHRFGPDCSVISGIWTGAIAHDTSRVRILTGTQSGTMPDLHTRVGSVHGKDLPLGSVDLSGLSLSGNLAASTGQVGFQSQIATLLNPYDAFRAPDGATYQYPLHVPEMADQTATRDFLRRRLEAFAGGVADGQRNDQRVADRRESMSRADRFSVQGLSVLDSLRPGERPSLDTQVRLAVDLLQRDLCASVMLETTQHWDSHDGNALQHSYYEPTFRGLVLLGELLEQTGLKQDTLVVLISEMTRTPKLNGRGGKDHWPHCSALLYGAGFPTKRRFGGTNAYIESELVDLASGEVTPSGELLKYDNFVAGMLAGMDIDPGDHLPGVTPFTGWIK